MIWKNVEWTKWLYQCNNSWEIKSLNYNHTWKEKILKQCNFSWWYKWLSLFYNWIKKSKLVHKIIIESFIWINKWKQVNHIDGDKSNNNINNLEYVTAKENMHHRFYKLWKFNFKTNNPKPMLWKFWISNYKSIKIKQFNLEWFLIKEWDSITQASKELLLNKSWIIWCLKWRLKKSWWFLWQYS